MTTRQATGPSVPLSLPRGPSKRSRAGQDRRSSGWRVPAALILLSAIPLAAGALRLVQLTGGPAVIPADDRFAGFPAALVVHILGAAVLALLGALQLAPRFRRRHRTWHRRSGRVVAAAGLAVAGSALWLTLFYEPQPGTGNLLFVLRLVFAPALAASLLLGVVAIRRGDIASHRAWMMRTYAIGLGAGTQVFTEGVAEAVVGAGELRLDLAKGTGWVINLAVAEWAIRRPARQGRRRPGGTTGTRSEPVGAPT